MLLYNLGLRSTLKPQCGEVSFIVKSGIGLSDLRLCLLQLCLPELNNRAESQAIPCIGQVQCGVGLLQELRGHTHFLLCSVRSQPGCADIPYDAIDEHPALLVGRLGAQVGFRSLGMEFETLKDPYFDIDPCRSIPIRGEVCA